MSRAKQSELTEAARRIKSAEAQVVKALTESNWAVRELLSLTGESTLDKSVFRVTPDLPLTDPQHFVERFPEEL